MGPCASLFSAVAERWHDESGGLLAITCHFADGDLLQCRFAISPLLETTDALRSLLIPGRESYQLPWQRQVRGRLAGLELEPLAAVLRLPGYQPDFLNPPPQGPYTEFDAELQQLIRTPPERVVAELGQALHASPAGQAALRTHPELGGEPE